MTACREFEKCKYFKKSACKLKKNALYELTTTGKIIAVGLEKQAPPFCLKEKNMAKSKLENIVEPVVEALGYEVVRVLLSGNVRQTLQVMIDMADGSRPVTVDDCAKVSRKLSKVLDETNPIENEYTLEVSSPGIDRPLTKPHHFKRFEGSVVRLETIEAVDGRKRIKGVLLNKDASNNVHINMDGKEYVVAFDNILKAKLVLTDELLAKYENEQSDETEI